MITSLNLRLFARLSLAALLLVAAGYVANRARYISPDYAVADLPLPLQPGFSIKHSFQAEANGELCFVLQRPSPEELDLRETFDPDGVVADFEITANGATVVQGRYPPHIALWRSWSAADENRAFGNFRVVAGKRYQLEFHIVEAPSSAPVKSGRLKIMVDRVQSSQIEMFALLLDALLIAAFIVSLPLLRRLPSLFRAYFRQEKQG